ncbi:hypothetical protein DFJ73DRAFT_763793 [Zopfochytrium polystomum]|nr:hypothetical protein DFJ73DRAFT_763793 [Zopfochytrium polystomum]
MPLTPKDWKDEHTTLFLKIVSAHKGLLSKLKSSDVLKEVSGKLAKFSLQTLAAKVSGVTGTKGRLINTTPRLLTPTPAFWQAVRKENVPHPPSRTRDTPSCCFQSKANGAKHWIDPSVAPEDLLSHPESRMLLQMFLPIDQEQAVKSFTFSVKLPEPVSDGIGSKRGAQKSAKRADGTALKISCAMVVTLKVQEAVGSSVGDNAWVIE